MEVKNPSSWVELLKSARKTAIIQDGKQKIHFTFNDGSELTEEYDVNSNNLLVRKWRRKTKLGAKQTWEVEIGEPEHSPTSLTFGTEHLVESFSNPICVRLDTKRAFQWRIRNLPYPISTYDVTVGDDERTIVVRTTNKKYFKKLNIPDMDRRNLTLKADELTFAHANNTLIVQYRKPKSITNDEEILIKEFKRMEVSNDGDVDCKQS